MQGIKVFRNKPGEMFLFGNTYLFIILFVGILIPVLGAAIVAMISPAMAFGVMLAGQLSQKGIRVTPAVLFNAFSPDNRAHTKSLIMLGAIYTGCFAIIKLLAYLLLGSPPNITVEDFQNADPETRAAFAEYIVLNMIFVGISSTPVLMAFWFAPVLVVWHNMKPVQALFGSWIAMWRNKSSFLIYGMGWLVLSLGFSAIFMVFLMLLGLPQAVISALNMICLALILSVTLCTFYPSYQAVFQQNPQT